MRTTCTILVRCLDILCSDRFTYSHSTLPSVSDHPGRAPRRGPQNCRLQAARFLKLHGWIADLTLGCTNVCAPALACTLDYILNADWRRKVKGCDVQAPTRGWGADLQDLYDWIDGSMLGQSLTCLIRPAMTSNMYLCPYCRLTRTLRGAWRGIVGETTFLAVDGILPISLMPDLRPPRSGHIPC